jgi:D-alanyl-D-alanine carboxypeptidase/D-alanyl-D-alanine-endopeptidase (penicillin-binding protein 4)
VVGGTTARDIIIVGGGDPYLSSKPVKGKDRTGIYPETRADVVTLARRTATALDKSGVTRVRLGYDDSLFTGPTASPQWEPDYVPDGVVSPITSLWVDRGVDPDGFGRVADPASAAATAFADALTRAGVKVVGGPTRVRAAAGAAQLAEVESAPLEQIVQQVLTVSDNEATEVLLRHVGLSVSGDGSFAGGAAGVEQTLRRLGVPLDGAAIYDGSGLSRRNRLSPTTVIGVLRVAASESHPELRSVLGGLPVAGFTGSLTNRFDAGEAAGRGRVRAKTGTLSGVHGLAGIAEDLDGNLMAFILVADRVALRNSLDAEVELDRTAAELGACHCGRSG